MTWRELVLYACAFLVAAEAYGGFRDWWNDINVPAGKVVYETYSNEVK